MRTLYKAQPLGDREAPPLRLEAIEELPDVGSDKGWHARSIARFDEQASIVIDALFGSLPGGTLDAILMQMLERRRSLYVVRFDTNAER